MSDYEPSNSWQRIEKALTYIDISDQEMALANRIDLNAINKKFGIMELGIRGELDRIKRRLAQSESKPGALLVLVGALRFLLGLLCKINRVAVRITFVG